MVVAPISPVKVHESIGERTRKEIAGGIGMTEAAPNNDVSSDYSSREVGLDAWRAFPEALSEDTRAAMLCDVVRIHEIPGRVSEEENQNGRPTPNLYDC